MPDELSPRHLRTRLLQLGAIVGLVVAVVFLGPGLGSLRAQFDQISPGWLALAAALELGSALSYVVVFRGIFCPRMSWRTSYQIAMSEQAANSLLPAGGAGGLALGAWALNRGGMSAEHIGRRSVAFFLITSLAKFGTLIVFAALFALGILSGDRAPAFTFGFAVAGIVVTAIVLVLPALMERRSARRSAPASNAGRIRSAFVHTRNALADGVRDAVDLLRQRSVGVLLGSFGYMAFDIAVLGACFQGFGYLPPVGVLVVAYLVGQLGGLLPIPIGGIEGGLIGSFALFHTPLAVATVAVLVYRALALWIPGLLGSVAFVRLRRTLRRDEQPAMICQPLVEPVTLNRSGMAVR